MYLSTLVHVSVWGYVRETERLKLKAGLCEPHVVTDTVLQWECLCCSSCHCANRIRSALLSLISYGLGRLSINPLSKCSLRFWCIFIYFLPKHCKTNLDQCQEDEAWFCSDILNKAECENIETGWILFVLSHHPPFSSGSTLNASPHFRAINLDRFDLTFICLIDFLHPLGLFCFLLFLFCLFHCLDIFLSTPTSLCHKSQ